MFERCWLYAVPASVRRRAPQLGDVRHRPRERRDHPHRRRRAPRLLQRVPAPRPPPASTRRAGGRAASCCPYHAWSYRLDGSVRTVFDREVFPADLELPTLHPARPRRHLGWPRVDLPRPRRAGPSASTSASCPTTSPATRSTASPSSTSQTVHWDCNWKVAMDAFHESYHTLGTHPQMLSYVADTNVQIDCYGLHSRFHMPWGAPAPRVANRRRPNATQVERCSPPTASTSSTSTAPPTRPTSSSSGASRPGCSSAGYPVDELGPAPVQRRATRTRSSRTSSSRSSAERCLLTRHRPDPTDPQRMFFDAQSFASGAPGEPWPEHPATRIGAGADFPLMPDFLMQDARNAPAVQAGHGVEGLPRLACSAISSCASATSTPRSTLHGGPMSTAPRPRPAGVRRPVPRLRLRPAPAAHAARRAPRHPHARRRGLRGRRRHRGRRPAGHLHLRRPAVARQPSTRLRAWLEAAGAGWRCTPRSAAIELTPAGTATPAASPAPVRDARQPLRRPPAPRHRSR